MSKSSKSVELFIVGQPKSGTTALAQYLSMHPQICMSVPKEPAYFATDVHRDSDEFHGEALRFPVRTPESYASLFTEASDASVLGDASTCYLYSKEAATNICEYNPQAKIVVSLREPVSMIHALHSQFVNEAVEDEPDFAAAVEKESLRKQGQEVPPGVRAPSFLYYSERMKYAEQLERYVKQFPPEQILVFTAEEMRGGTADIYQRVLSLVGVDSSFQPSFEAVHESKRPRFARVNRALRNPRFTKTMNKVLGHKVYTGLQKRVVEPMLLKNQKRDAMPAELRDRLRAQVRDDVERLSDLLDRDLINEWGYS